MPSANPPGRRCLGAGGRLCDQIIRRGSRCPSCLRAFEGAREKRKTVDRRRHGKRTGSTRAWRALRLEVFERDFWKCRLCGLQDPTGRRLHADHIVPRSKGGSDHITNLRTLCAGCNLKRGAKAP